MRLIFLGNDPWSVPALEMLAEDPGFEILDVITNPPRPAGRGSVLTPTAVASAARALGIAPLEVEGVRGGAGFDAIRDGSPDVLVVVAYGELLSPDALARPRFGAVNLHFSLLPRWRGASPVQHTLLAGDDRAGVTLMQMDEGLDSGPIIATAVLDIRTDDDAGSLGARLADAGAELLRASLPAAISGELQPLPQPDDGVTQAPKLGPAERLVNWSEDARAIERRVRAFSPDPGAQTTFRGEQLKVLRADVVEDLERSPSIEPGTVVYVDTSGPLIAAGSGSVRLSLVGPSGRTHMSGADWARGARIQPGERLG
jgi:methionyl-tRNA formyltransferase